MKNQYPEKLINQKIKELRTKKFPPSQSKARRAEELKNPEIVSHNITLPFTSFRCSVIASKIKKILSQFTTNFKLNITFTSIKMSSVISPRLKPKKSYYLNSNCIYEYNCEEPCEAKYQGETQRILHERILEHRREESSAIFQHYKYCDHYDKKIRDKYKVPNPEYLPQSLQRKNFESHFKILEKNLYHKGFRKTFEGLLITLNKPSLNVQVPHECMTFLCTCIIPDTSIT